MNFKYEFLAAPRLEIPGTDLKLALITNPRTVYLAQEFCHFYGNGGTLYDITPEYKIVVDFAETYGINQFYISLNDNETENTFVNSDDTILSHDYDNLWMKGEPNNYIPDSHQFCEGNFNLFMIIIKICAMFA